KAKTGKGNSTFVPLVQRVDRLVGYRTRYEGNGPWSRQAERTVGLDGCPPLRDQGADRRGDQAGWHRGSFIVPFSGGGVFMEQNHAQGKGRGETMAVGHTEYGTLESSLTRSQPRERKIREM